ncbi:zinc finger domain-containing protein [Variovorax sp. HJSM1_2]
MAAAWADTWPNRWCKHATAHPAACVRCWQHHQRVRFLPRHSLWE